MIVKEHHKGGNIIVAVCDTELLGKKFEENGVVLDLSSPFYQGKEMDEDETKSILKKAGACNLVGKVITQLALREGMISEENILHCQNIPFAQSVIIRE
ncbi:MAG: DUF424 family protein [Candidatus Woesearchaeota archaeon]|jgi:hypothetical protein|nr:DUF424 family protein [Candidatus Woesearchaeota archaeon]MDP7181792.1 DUF424 family protein [Candidatus Woesearchaeota archaeon]MDP7198881.1 DUF424 family protein [Candidatus Woesearchaeota archaeon]MDP7467119.1 DUF424 family protein [Candidatus Woesearchaeota archaeon]MDP7647546.1 DUF424 family protein [Candidatus Woesearchaeota archaeon]